MAAHQEGSMKRLVFAFAIVAGLAGTAFAGAVTVQYHNGDSQRHTFEAVCSGSKQKLVTDANTTGTATIQGSGPCKVKHAGGEILLKGGEKLEIKKGAISTK
jgi:hypothetical protein